MSIFGTYYALTPHAAASGLARAHYALTLAAVLVLIPGIVLAITERTEILAKTGSVLAISAMALFVVVLLRNGVGKGAEPRRPALRRAGTAPFCLTSLHLQRYKSCQPLHRHPARLAAIPGGP
jgi:hypothetical protein